MEKKCPHQQNRLVCRSNRREAVSEQSRTRGGTNSGKVRRMKIIISPTTGGQLEVCVSQHETVRGLKLVLARKYRINPTKINLLHKDRVLKDGTLQDNEVRDGSRLVLCPNMESGTSSTHAEHTVMQALKNLSEAQVHDFLTGKSPLTLAIRLGEHLMFVQLQLSTAPSSRSVVGQPPAALTSNPAPSSTPSPSPSSSSSASPSSSSPSAAATPGNAVGNGSASASGGVSPVFMPAISPVSLLQASRNLTEKLKELTQLTHQTLQAGVQRSQALPSTLPPTPPPSPPPSPGAVIDSMQQVGKGVFSGTFSGTLDPRLQDRTGQPRRDVNTILHILHDLLVAQPSGNMAASPARAGSSNSRAPPSSSTFSASSSTTLGSMTTEGGEATAMRDKVQQVQRMLELRRQRRSARRQSQRPYPCPSSSVCLHHSSAPSASSSAAFLSADSSNPHSSAAAPTTAENVETSNYRKPNMEQETVAV